MMQEAIRTFWTRHGTRKSNPVLTSTDMKVDLDLIDRYRTDADTRKANAGKRRLVREQPPKATVL
jgi:hypothetical protein